MFGDDAAAKMGSGVWSKPASEERSPRRDTELDALGAAMIAAGVGTRLSSRAFEQTCPSSESSSSLEIALLLFCFFCATLASTPALSATLSMSGSCDASTGNPHASSRTSAHAPASSASSATVPAGRENAVAALASASASVAGRAASLRVPARSRRSDVTAAFLGGTGGKVSAGLGLKACAGRTG